MTIKKDGTISIEEGSSKNPRWYSVRCVQDVEQK